MPAIRLAAAAAALLLAAGLAGPARAGDAPAPAPDDVARARAAYAAWQVLEEESRAAQGEFSAKVQAAPTEAEKKALREEWMKGMRPRGIKAERASEEFRKAFASCPAPAFDAKADAALLEQGLMLVGQEAVADDPKAAVAAFERVLADLPGCPSALHARCTWLPIALSSTGDLVGAARRIEELMAGAPENQRAGMAAARGDALALAGDVEGARKIWAGALAAIPADLDKEKYDPRKMAKASLEDRLALIGRAAPEIDAKTWLGGEARPLSALRGRVVVLDFWATWCGPCLHGIPGMIALAKARPDAAVLGVTTHYKNGFLPSGPDQLRWNFKEGETAQLVGPDGAIDEKANLDLLARFRERIPMPYPTVVASRADFSAYRVAGIPTVVVIAKDGRIAFLAVGSRREALIRLAVERLLDEPYDPSAPPPPPVEAPKPPPPPPAPGPAAGK